MSTEVICFANQKGEVGKATAAVSTAHGLTKKNWRAFLINLDPQGQSAKAQGHNPKLGAIYLLTKGRTPEETTIMQEWI